MFAGAVAEVARREFGGDCEPIEREQTIGLTASEAIGADPERVLLTFVNLSANTIYLRTRPDVSSARGIYLSANGGSVSLIAREDAVLVSSPWFAVATGAGSVLQMVGLRRISIKKT